MTLNITTTRASNTLDFDARTSASRSKFIKDRVTSVERSFGDMCSTFGAIARKNSKLRDKGDDLSRHLLDYSDTLTYNSSCKASLAAVSRELAACNDYQDAMVKRIECHVTEPLGLYNTVIKQSRTDIDNAFRAYDKEQKSRKAVDLVRERNPSDRQQLSRAESELQRAHVDASRNAKALEKAIDEFEEKKLCDIKQTLSDYVKIQMSFHAKCLETLTRAHRNLMVINEQEDLQEFRNILYPSSATERLEMMKSSSAISGSRGSLTSVRSNKSPAASPSKQVTRGAADMFTTQRTSAQQQRNANSSPAAAETQKQSKSLMMGDISDDESEEESESEEDPPVYRA